MPQPEVVIRASHSAPGMRVVLCSCGWSSGIVSTLNALTLREQHLDRDHPEDVDE